MSDKRIIEAAFPLKQVSMDSVHEKSVRHGHISTLHIWPARRPLAAARAALIATLIQDPGDAADRKIILDRMAGRATEITERKRQNGRIIEKVKEVTTGGILHWGRENDPDLEWFRNEIKRAHGGVSPKVLDPFAGGGAIPLEAMRLGCEVTAMDINPVAWFILKCTLEYPQKLAGQTQALPTFAAQDRDFVEQHLKSKGFKGARLHKALESLGHTEDGTFQFDSLPLDGELTNADFAWHLRAWGRWLLGKKRALLASRYPTYAEFAAPASTDGNGRPHKRLLDTDEEGVPQVDSLNSKFDAIYLKNPLKPRWIAKPTVAYLWARTARCKQCRIDIPLLKTLWLCKREGKRVLLKMESSSNRTDFVFSVDSNPPHVGGNTAQRQQHDRRIGAATMTRSGATCPNCGVIMTMEDLRAEGRAGRLGKVMTAVVVNGINGKEYRLPTDLECKLADVPEDQLLAAYGEIPFGLPNESLPSAEAPGIRVPLYGFGSWKDLFTDRQLLALGEFTMGLRKLGPELEHYPVSWREALIATLALVNDRLITYSSAFCTWHNSGEKIRDTFARFALPMVWDYAEVNPLSDTTGNFLGALEWVARFVSHASDGVPESSAPTHIRSESAIHIKGEYDVILTDPPYYDAIPYSDLMDFFYVWLRRATHGLSPEIDAAFEQPLGPKWDHDAVDGELIDDASRFDGDRELSRRNYEEGMLKAFRALHDSLKSDGRLVVVFANKHPDAWEALVTALIRAGFVVVGSWPIQTEMSNRMRAADSAVLSSSVWLVCRKREASRPGWDNVILREMRENITQSLRDFWDAGIRGPDFVWAATGPALEAFSKHPVIKRANAANEFMSASDFLREVRRLVVDFVVGRVLTYGGDETVSGLDDVTTYYLLHRSTYGMKSAPVGGCILYALSCNLSDSALINGHDLLEKSGGRASLDDTGADETAGGGRLRLKAWNRRTGRNLGLETEAGRPVPLIDRVHRLMRLWRMRDQARVNDYIDMRGLKRNVLFNQILQALIETAETGSDERAVLEALSNHLAVRGDVRVPKQRAFAM